MFVKVIKFSYHSWANQQCVAFRLVSLAKIVGEICFISEVEKDVSVQRQSFWGPRFHRSRPCLFGNTPPVVRQTSCSLSGVLAQLRGSREYSRDILFPSLS